ATLTNWDSRPRVIAVHCAALRIGIQRFGTGDATQINGELMPDAEVCGPCCLLRPDACKTGTRNVRASDSGSRSLRPLLHLRLAIGNSESRIWNLKSNAICRAYQVNARPRARAQTFLSMLAPTHRVDPGREPCVSQAEILNDEYCMPSHDELGPVDVGH